MKTRRYVAIVCLLFFSLLARAEELNPVLKQYNVNQGLADNYVTSITQDREGYIWIGTHSGISRFDGFDFRTYSQFANQTVQAIKSDNRGNLYAIVDGKVFTYSKNDDIFVPCLTSDGVSDTRFSSIMFDKDNGFWIMERRGLIYRFDENLQLIRTFDSNNASRFTDFSFDQHNRCWVSDNAGHLTCIDIEHGTQQSYPLFAKADQPLSYKLYRVFPSLYSDRVYVAYEKDDIIVFSASTGEYYNLDIQGHYNKAILIVDLIETEDNSLWIATNDGIIIYNVESKEWSEIHYQTTNIHSLQSQIITKLYQDRENNIWIGSPVNGLSHYARSPFTVHYPTSSQTGIQGEIVRDIIADGNRIWLSTEDNGISIYDKDKKRFSNFTQMPYPDIKGMSISEGKVWVSYLIHGIESYDMNGHKLKSYSITSDDTSGNVHINTSLVLSDGTLLIATYRGLYRYDSVTDSFMRVTDITSNLYYTLREDKANNRLLYAGHYCLLTDFAQGNYNFKAIEIPSYTNLGNDLVVDLTTDSEGNTWYLTNRSGVFKIDKKTQEVTRLQLNKKSPNTQMLRILSDDYGKVWVASMSGLHSIDIHDCSTQIYTEADGLQTNQFNNYAGCIDADGILYWGTTKGLVLFDPKHFGLTVPKEKIIVTSVSYYDQHTKQTEQMNILPDIRNLTFKDWQNTIRMNLSTLTYQKLGGIQFQYQIGNGDWNEAISNQIVLNNLSPGKYKMKIQAVDRNDMPLSEEPLGFTLTVLPPWWQSTWAYIGYLLMTALLLYLFVASYIRWQKRKMEHQVLLFESEKEKELYETKIDFFTNIAHEIRTPVTLIKDPLDRLLKSESLTQNDTAALEVMEKNTNRLLDLVNQLLNFKSKENRDKNLIFVHTEIISFFNDIVNTCRFAIEKKNMVLNKSIDLPELYADIDKEGFRKIVYNLLTNAVKYGDHTISVHVYLDKEQQHFFIDFINDGTPIPAADQSKVFEPLYRSPATQHIQGTGLGLSITSFLVNLHHGNLTLVQSNEEATIFRIKMPVKQDSLFVIKCKEPAEHLSSRQEWAEEPVTSDSITILVVEDDKDMNRYIASLLKEKYKVITAENGKEAIDVLSNQSVNLVVSDVVMPVMDGLGLLQELKANLSFSHIPIVLLTSQASVEDRLKGLESGADAYIDKPFSTEILLAQISNLLQSRESIRQFYFKSPIANMKSMAFSKADELFLDKLNSIINENLSDEDLNVNTLAEHMNMSRATLYRKIKSMSKTTPNELITMTRLKKAAELLANSDMKVYEVSNAVGFSSQSYFWTAFTKHFGVSPSKYVSSVGDHTHLK